MTISLSGIGVSRGIVMGKVHVLERGQPEVTEYSIPSRLIDEEVERFNSALDTARSQLKAIQRRIPPDTAADIAAFIDTHLLMLDDSTLARIPVDVIRKRKCNAEWALKLQRDSLVDVFDQMDDPYLRTRRDDVAHVVNRVLRILINQDTGHDSSLSLRDHIVIADDLTPADTVLLQHQGIAGFVTEYGGPLSHTAILARSLQIPAVVGVHRARSLLHNDEEIVIDGREGNVVADIDAGTAEHYKQLQREERNYFLGLRKLKKAQAVTLDQHRITLHANIELPEDIKLVKQVEAGGIGLYRTELLFMNRTGVPDEEEQLADYRRVLSAMDGRPVTIRTLDLGADKQSEEARSGPLAANPALGLRAVRLCLKDPDLFRPQLRAIIRASAYGPVRLMVPMLSNMLELQQVMRMIEETKRELRRHNTPFDENLPVGGMIEVPAAAVSAGMFAQNLDFLSIGTNDLIQYTLAIDRIDDEVNYLYDPLHPAVLRLIYLTLKAARTAGIPVSMCGEMASDCRYTRLLLGLGLREFSTHPASLLEVKDVVTRSRIDDLSRPARRILACHHQDRIREMLQRLNAREQ